MQCWLPSSTVIWSINYLLKKIAVFVINCTSFTLYIQTYTCLYMCVCVYVCLWTSAKWITSNKTMFTPDFVIQHICHFLDLLHSYTANSTHITILNIQDWLCWQRCVMLQSKFTALKTSLMYHYKWYIQFCSL